VASSDVSLHMPRDACVSSSSMGLSNISHSKDLLVLVDIGVLHVLVDVVDRSHRSLQCEEQK
jgi:hypothetical protein